MKRRVAEAALAYVEDDSILGVGTGSTVNCFIDALAESGKRIDSAVSSSEATSERLKAIGVRVVDLNQTGGLTGPQRHCIGLALLCGGGPQRACERIDQREIRPLVNVGCVANVIIDDATGVSAGESLGQHGRRSSSLPNKTL